MSFLKEIEPLYKYVELALKGSGYPNKGIIEKISNIDYKLRQKERLRIYGNAKAEVYPTDLSCGACIRSMFTNVQRWVNIYNNEKETVEFKGVPQVEVLNEVDSKPVSEMKWGEFKTYCKDLGLSVKGKKRSELEEELKESL
jgi:hypothetical protein